jgi:hypothetical protein
MLCEAKRAAAQLTALAQSLFGQTPSSAAHMNLPDCSNPTVLKEWWGSSRRCIAALAISAADCLNYEQLSCRNERGTDAAYHYDGKLINTYPRAYKPRAQDS